MGTGWRRAFCTSSGDQETAEKQQSSRSPRSCVKLGIFSSGSGGSNPSTPRLLQQPVFSSSSGATTPRYRGTKSPPPPPPAVASVDSPKKLQCKTNSLATSTGTTPTSTTTPAKGSPRRFKSFPPNSTTSSSPRSPSRFSLFKTALRFSRNRCGICAQSVRTGSNERTAVFTAECSHVFHFPCISSHVRSQGCLVCPVCSASWNEVPGILSSSLHHPPESIHQQQHQAYLLERCLLEEENREQRKRATTTNKDSDERRGSRQGGDGLTSSPKASTPAAATKVYNDDESLRLPSPNSRGRGVLQFNPIPEADDEDDINDEEEGEEAEEGSAATENFTPLEQLSSSSRCTTLKGITAGAQVDISVMPEAAALVSTGRNHQSYVISIKVKAPALTPQAAANNNTSGLASGGAAGGAAAAVHQQSLLEPPSCRAPIDLVTVLDVSGSMSVAKLQMLKRAMRLVISSLGAKDRLSIVAFSMIAAKRLLPLRRMSRQGQRSARQIVDRLIVCGSNQQLGQSQSDHCSPSCMGDALRKATKVLEDRRERNPVATIMLLSDGHTSGQQKQQQQKLEQDQHRQQCSPRGTTTSTTSNHSSSATRFTHLEIPIHASGFGDAAAAGIAQQQQQKQCSSGMQAVGEDAFVKCVSGLVSVVLQDVRIRLEILSGVISCVYSYGGGDSGISRAVAHNVEGGKSVCLGDMYAGEERELLVELKVPKVPAVRAGGQAMSITAKCSFQDPTSREVIQLVERPLVMPPPQNFENPSSSQSPRLLRSLSFSSSVGKTNNNVQEQQQHRLRNLFVTARAMAESRRLVDVSDLDTAAYLLSSARSLVLQQPNTAASVLKSLNKNLVLSLEAALADLQRQQRWQQQQQQHSLSPSHRRTRNEQSTLLQTEARGVSGGGGEPLTPTSAWRAAEQLAKVAIMRKSLNRVSDLHGLENARF